MRIQEIVNFLWLQWRATEWVHTEEVKVSNKLAIPSETCTSSFGTNILTKNMRESKRKKKGPREEIAATNYFIKSF